MAHTLLLADDNLTIQRVIELTFADEDISVVAVSDGDKAIASLDRKPPDIVLADIGMPGRSGYDIARHMKRTPALAHIPVLLLTGAFEPIDASMVADIGCDGVLTKPFEPQQVIRRVKELLQKSGLVTTFLEATPSLRSHAGPEPQRQPEPRLEQEPDRVPEPRPERQAEREPESRLEREPDRAPEARLEREPEREAEPRLERKPERESEPRREREPEREPEPQSQPQGEREPETIPAPVADTVPTAAVERRDESPVPMPQPRKDTDVDSYFEELDQAFASLITVDRGPTEAFNRPMDEPVVAPLSEMPHVSSAHASPAPRASLADAFAALLAAEGASSQSPASLPGSMVGSGEPPVTDELVERVTRRVLERVSEESLRAMVERIVSATAERLIREEIERIKSNIT